MAESDIEQAIKQSAQGPAKAQGDSGSVEQHGLADQIEADRYLQSKKASRSKGLKVKFVPLDPPRSLTREGRSPLFPA